ncbi:polyprenyl synthetase family protein [Erysipelotrichaceae bacterium 7770_A6]|nr:polyprenyl synthetase family protein [Erysipelotrichaceae bacterium 7770_A6]
MRIEKVLEEKIDELADSKVKEAMRYSLIAPGKRVRPNLLYEVVKGYGLLESVADEFACAIEMIHTYSLIHDDLPAMDNDDLRRGRLTCHKQFDEATAILAGDGLLTYAFDVASSSTADPSIVVKCIQVLAQCAGSNGMVLGQDLDMNESNTSDWDYVRKVHKYKTGCLLSAPLMMGALLAGKNDETVRQWHEIGISLGLAFQIQDDILDVELSSEEFGKSNSDEKNDKKTSVSLLGLEQSKELMISEYEKVKQSISEMHDFNGEKLISFIESIEKRRK